MSKIGNKVEETLIKGYKNNYNSFKKIIDDYNSLSKEIISGGGRISIEKQHSKGRLTVRERIDTLIDSDTVFLELGKFAAYKMYEEYGKINGVPAYLQVRSPDK